MIKSTIIPFLRGIEPLIRLPKTGLEATFKTYSLRIRWVQSVIGYSLRSIYAFNTYPNKKWPQMI